MAQNQMIEDIDQFELDENGEPILDGNGEPTLRVEKKYYQQPDIPKNIQGTPSQLFDAINKQKQTPYQEPNPARPDLAKSDPMAPLTIYGNAIPIAIDRMAGYKDSKINDPNVFKEFSKPISEPLKNIGGKIGEAYGQSQYYQQAPYSGIVGDKRSEENYKSGYKKVGEGIGEFVGEGIASIPDPTFLASGGLGAVAKGYNVTRPVIKETIATTRETIGSIPKHFALRAVQKDLMASKNKYLYSNYDPKWIASKGLYDKPIKMVEKIQQVKTPLIKENAELLKIAEPYVKIDGNDFINKIIQDADKEQPGIGLSDRRSNLLNNVKNDLVKSMDENGFITVSDMNNIRTRAQKQANFYKEPGKSSMQIDPEQNDLSLINSYIYKHARNSISNAIEQVPETNGALKLKLKENNRILNKLISAENVAIARIPVEQRGAIYSLADQAAAIGGAVLTGNPFGAVAGIALNQAQKNAGIGQYLFNIGEYIAGKGTTEREMMFDVLREQGIPESDINNLRRYYRRSGRTGDFEGVESSKLYNDEQYGRTGTEWANKPNEYNDPSATEINAIKGEYNKPLHEDESFISRVNKLTGTELLPSQVEMLINRMNKRGVSPELWFNRRNIPREGSIYIKEFKKEFEKLPKEGKSLEQYSRVYEEDPEVRNINFSDGKFTDENGVEQFGRKERVPFPTEGYSGEDAARYENRYKQLREQDRAQGQDFNPDENLYEDKEYITPSGTRIVSGDIPPPNSEYWNRPSSKAMEPDKPRRVDKLEQVDIKKDNYKMDHKAPTRDDGYAEPISNIKNIYPEDIYSSNGARYYGDGSDYDQESINILRYAKNNKNAKINIYRAVPDLNSKINKDLKDLKETIGYYNKFNFFPDRKKIKSQKVLDLIEKNRIPDGDYNKQQSQTYDALKTEITKLENELNKDIKLNDGDWVTINKKYAKDHGDAHINGPYKIITKKVYADEIYTDGNSIHEQGYSPRKKSKNTEDDNRLSQEQLETIKKIPSNKLEQVELAGVPEGKLDNPKVIEHARKLWDKKGTDSPYFKRWFGDSKVVDKDGKPLVVYHGSPDVRFIKKDATFRNPRTGETKGAHWFTPSKRTAETYADDLRAWDYQNAEPGVIGAYLEMKNPLIVDAKGGYWRDAQRRGKTSDIIEEAQQKGHDGVIIRNVMDDYNNSPKTKPTDTYVVFESTQIKSATGNRGTFDPTDANILRQSNVNRSTTKGTATPTDNGARLEFGKNADIATAIHEVEHSSDIMGKLKDSDRQAFMKAMGLKEWDNEAKERFAYGVEYLAREGELPNEFPRVLKSRLKEIAEKTYGKDKGVTLKRSFEDLKEKSPSKSLDLAMKGQSSMWDGLPPEAKKALQNALKRGVSEKRLKALANGIKKANKPSVVARIISQINREYQE